MSRLHYFLCIGLIQGLIFLATHELWDAAGAARSYLIGLCVFAAGFGISLQLLNRTEKPQLPWRLFLLSLLIAGLSIYSYQLDDAAHHGSQMPVFLALAVVIMYIAISFEKAWPAESNSRWPRFDYSQLYQHGWGNAFAVAAGMGFSALFWILIALWVGLFKLIKIDFFEDLFFDEHFLLIALPSSFSLGLMLSLEKDHLLQQQRQLVLLMARFLLPMACFIAILFALTLPFTGLQAIWDTGHASAILLSMNAALLFLFNKWYQDGNELSAKAAYKRMIEFGLVLVSVFAALSLQAISLRVTQYGLTPQRVYALLFASISFAYGLAYLWAIFRSKAQWLDGVRAANLAVAGIIVSSLLILHIPGLTPTELSVKNQLSRWYSESIPVDELDLGAMKFRWGRAGEEALAQLRAEAESEEDKNLLAAFKRLDESKHYYQWQRPDESHKNFAWLKQQEQDVPAELSKIAAEYCHAGSCYLLPYDLNADGTEEMIVLSSYDDKHLYLNGFMKKIEGRWTKGGRFDQVGHRALSLDELRNQGFQRRTAEYDNLQLGDRIWHTIDDPTR